MELVTNKLNGEKVREEEFRGKQYLVAPVTPIKAMELDKGYVPSEEVAKSAPAWNGIPLTLGHPRNENGDLISANAPSVGENTWLGYLFDNKAVNGGEKTEGEAWFDIDAANDLGGAAKGAIKQLRNGKSLSVSTSYYFDRLKPGEYDGEHHNEVSGNLRPDHVAVLVNEDGQCSIEDGCAIGERATNNENGLTLAAIPDDSVSPENGQDEDVYGHVSDNQQNDGPNGQVADSGSDDKVQADDMTEDNQTVEEAATHYQRFLQALNLGGGQDNGPDGEQTEDEPAEPGAANDNDMKERTQELVENHEFEEENLPSEDSECFDRIYDAFAGNSGEATVDDDSDDDDTSEAETETEEEDTMTMTASQLDELKSDVREDARKAAKEEIEEANEIQRRSELVSEISSNSDDYDEDSLEDTPIPVLENIRDDVAVNEDETEGYADFSAIRGASANASNSDETNMPSLTATDRIQEMESED